MHERIAAKIRNPGKPGKEVLPCKLTTEELRPRWQRVGALRHQRLGVEAELQAAKAKAKARLDELSEEEGAVWKTINAEAEDRQVDVEYLADEVGGFMYARRLDTGELVRRRQFTRREKEDAKQGKLFELDGPTRVIDVPEDIETVRRFDVDTADVGQEEDEPAGGNGSAPAEASDGGDEQHECSFDDGVCMVCGLAEPDGDAEATKPARRKKGTRGRGGAAEVH